jgi:DNA-binding YbaB/EbfC family protein
MFREIGQLASLLKAAPRIKEEMGKLQARLSQLAAEGDAGGGMVKIKVNGHMDVIGCSLAEQALAMADRELLEEMIKSAANQAIDKARRLVTEETSKAAGALGIDGMPNLSSLMG